MKYWQKLQDPRWQKKRLQIMERDGFKCRDCSDDKSSLQVHHCAYREEPWDAPNDALMTLCANCHENRQSAERATVILLRRAFSKMTVLEIRQLKSFFRAKLLE